MDAAALPTNLIGLVALVVVTGGGILTTLLTVKRGGKAGEVAQETDRGVDEAERYMKLQTSLMDRIDRQDESIRKQDVFIKELRTSQDVNDELMASLRERISQLSKDLDFMHIWRRAALRYILDLRAFGLRHATEDKMPLPPEELLGDLQRGN